MTMISVPGKHINAEFDDIAKPKDERLQYLLQKAHAHSITCRDALIPFEQIKPFSSTYEPKIPPELVRYFEAALEERLPPKLLVYEDGGDFVMGADYALYYLYKQEGAAGAAEVPCTVLDPSGKTVDSLQWTSDPYFLGSTNPDKTVVSQETPADD